jgi:hypothetical protein
MAKVYWEKEGAVFIVYGSQVFHKQVMDDIKSDDGYTLALKTVSEIMFLVHCADEWIWIKADECTPWEDDG